MCAWRCHACGCGCALPCPPPVSCVPAAHRLGLKPGNTISVEPDRVTIQGGATFGCVDCEASRAGGGVTHSMLSV